MANLTQMINKYNKQSTTNDNEIMCNHQNKSGSANYEEIEAIVNKQVCVKLEQFDKMYEKTFHDQVNELIEFRHAEMEIGNK